MIHIEEYIQIKNVSRRTIERYIEAGDLLSLKKSGRTYIVDPVKLNTLKERELKALVKEVKIEFDSMLEGVAKGKNDQVIVFEEIQKRMEMLGRHGVEIKGYSLKSLYRKANDAAKVKRKARCDKFAVRNKLLDDILNEKVIPFAAKIYVENAQPNVSLLCDLMKMYAKETEEYYEIAAIPKGTLYRQIRNSFEASGFPDMHKFMNHHNRFHIDLPFTSTAFTSEISFMDYIIGDDHKADVARVYVYDEASGRVVEKQVKTWFWIEGKTMMPLGWVIKIGDINSKDLIESLAVVLKKYGLPNNAVMVDNGIARAEDFTEFLRRINKPQAWAHFSKPYTPINKAPVERGFGMIKAEFDSFFENFVSPDKNRDARHRDLKMSPEETNLWFDDYKIKLESFIQQRYIQRERVRVINEERRRISILDYFDDCWRTHNKIEVTNRELRYAMMHEQIVKIGFGDLKFKGEYFIINEPLSVRFYNQKYRALYNPGDMNEIDLYILDDMLDRNTGEIAYRDTYFTTLYNIKSVSNKQSKIDELRRKIKMQFAELAKSVTSLQVMEFEKALPTYVSEDGRKLVETRRQYEKQVAEELKETVSTIAPVTTQLTTQIPNSEPRKLTQIKRTSLTIKGHNNG